MSCVEIKGRTELENLVSDFYARVRADALLAPIFEAQIRDNWAMHEARVCDFWETVLFGAPKFKSQSMLQHFEVDQMCPLCPFHFARWCELFEGCVDTQFEGEVADRAKCRARAMSHALLRQVEKSRGCPLTAVFSEETH